MCSGEAAKQLMCWRVSVALHAAKLEREAEKGVRELESRGSKAEGGGGRVRGRERDSFFKILG